MTGPLSGYRVIELAGIGPGPYAGQLLADMGAEVIVIERPVSSPIGGGIRGIDSRGKKSMVLDLRKPGASDVVLKLVETADVLIEGNRPGVTERLGVGPQECHAVNPKLVYGRMTGWGQNGPWAHVAGHDINYISITGALEAMGKKDNAPFPPLNFIGDYGGGTMFLISGVLAALLQATKTGKGDVVDAAIIDGASSMMGIIYSMHSVGYWQPKRHGNLLDGAMPFYRCYGTQDGRHMAIGCIEPQFFALMLKILEIDPADFGGQMDVREHASQHEKLEAIFATKTRDDWAKIFDGTDACVSPVLNYLEAAEHPQNKARGGLKPDGKLIHPRTAPVFESRGLDDGSFASPEKGSANQDILEALGYSQQELAALAGTGVIPETGSSSE